MTTRRRAWLWLAHAYRLGMLREIADAYLKHRHGVSALLNDPSVRARLRPTTRAAIEAAIHERVLYMLPTYRRKGYHHAGAAPRGNDYQVPIFKCEADYDDDSEPFC